MLTGPLPLSPVRGPRADAIAFKLHRRRRHLLIRRELLVVRLRELADARLRGELTSDEWRVTASTVAARVVPIDIEITEIDGALSSMREGRYR